MAPRRIALVLAALAALNACGFHLRGTGGAALPESLAMLRVTMPGRGTDDPTLVAVRRAFTAAGASLTEAAEAPTLVLHDERVETQVISVSTVTAKANEYRLRYGLSFRLDRGGTATVPQTVRLVREYTFDPTQILAKEQEERELLREMQSEAAQQIVRRVARLKPAEPPAGADEGE
ncbi:lipoprotein [Sulfurifustis variabilis]|uniref:LPS-assembly lipoprotein LptE n=1 Tax=Sulfurifustis variabilis TaxID=1675686 RepID=A0A1B4V126_9GAMM|nr:LPS assembly lipoprotein LptE [Sulfurifustis variabilis]BAU47179.1 lipoprotein [Sulfurifustis variabilis]